MTRAALLVAALLGPTLAVSGCSQDPTERYCEAVEEHQVELSEVAAAEGPGALFGALEPYEDLASKAPRDLVDEWDVVLRRLTARRDAVEDAGIEPADYDPASPPADLAADDRRAIEKAAADLGEPATVEAMAGIEQQALDVCKTPLSQ